MATTNKAEIVARAKRALGSSYTPPATNVTSSTNTGSTRAQLASAQKQLADAKSKLGVILQAKKAGMAGVGAGTTFKQAKGYLSSVLENPQPKLEYPQDNFMDSFQGNIDTSLGLSKAYLEGVNSELQGVQNNRTSSENELRRLMGIEAQEGARKNEMYQDADIAGQERDYKRMVSRIRSKNAQISAGDDRAFMAQAQLEGQGQDSRLVGRNQNAVARDRAIQRTAEAAELRAQVGVAELAQGDLESAIENIDRALEMEFAPIRKNIEMEMFFLNRIDRDYSDAKQEVTAARRDMLTSAKNELDTAQAMVMQAIATGGVNPQEAQELFNLRSNPQAQIQAATEIMGRVAQQDRALTTQEAALRNQQLRGSIANQGLSRRADLIALAGTGDPQAISELGYDPRNLELSTPDLINIEETGAQLNKDLTDIRALIDNKLAIKLSTGVMKGGFLSSFLETGVGMMPAKVIKEDFLNEIERFTGAYTLDNLIAKKAEGATFGALSDAELRVISSSASKLNSMLDKNPKTGLVQGLKGSEKALQAGLDDFKSQILNAIDKNSARLGLTEEELQQIYNSK